MRDLIDLRDMSMRDLIDLVRYSVTNRLMDICESRVAFAIENQLGGD